MVFIEIAQDDSSNSCLAWLAFSKPGTSEYNLLYSLACLASYNQDMGRMSSWWARAKEDKLVNEEEMELIRDRLADTRRKSKEQESE